MAGWLQQPKKRLLGYALLIGALLFSANPQAVSGFVHNHFITLVDNPKPPTTQSPWPWVDHATPHPLVRTIPAEAERSIQSVAKYFSEREPDPYLLAKALHDYVIKRVTYDTAVLDAGQRPPQDAGTVFRSRRGVCEGYANLYTALAQSSNLKARTVYGRLRRDLGPIKRIPSWLRRQQAGYDWTLHAWNAVNINGQWWLVDTTWDDLEQAQTDAIYRTDYLMPAPKTMIVSHLPDAPRWQLLNEPISESRFKEQPILRPGFFKQNLKILEPRKHHSTTKDTAKITIKHQSTEKPTIFGFVVSKADDSVWFTTSDLFKSAARNQEATMTCRTEPTHNNLSTLTCPLPKPGLYQAVLYFIDSKGNPHSPRIEELAQLSFESR
jgi:transglutaminase/protease-like cytokinesis protein 3